MSLIDRITSAEVSSDLQHHDKPCDVDTLGAVGMAAASAPMYMSLFRVKYLDDGTELNEAKRIFARWAYSAMVRANMSPASASRVGVQALIHWVSDTCKTCCGRGRMVIPGTPNLSDRECSSCKGTGKRLINQPKQLSEVWKELHSRADTAVGIIGQTVKSKYYD